MGKLFFHLFYHISSITGRAAVLCCGSFRFFRVLYRKLRAYFFCLQVFAFALGA